MITFNSIAHTYPGEAEQALSVCGAWQTVRQGHAGQVYFHLMRRG